MGAAHTRSSFRDPLDLPAYVPINNQAPPDTSWSSVFENDAKGSRSSLNSFPSLVGSSRPTFVWAEKDWCLLKVIDSDSAPSDRL